MIVERHTDTRKRLASGDLAPGPLPPPRPQRSNQGQGGRHEQLQRAYDIASQPGKPAKKTAFAGPSDLDQNSLAPEQRQKPKVRHGCFSSGLTPAAAQRKKKKDAPPKDAPPPPPPPPQSGPNLPLSRSTFTIPPGVHPNPTWAPPGPTVSADSSQDARHYQYQQQWQPRPEPQQYINLPSQYLQQQSSYRRPQADHHDGQMPNVFSTQHGPNDPVYLDHVAHQERPDNNATGFPSRGGDGGGSRRDSSDEEEEGE